MEGARQVGKTWLLKEFGKNEFGNVAYINCDTDDSSRFLFADFNIDRILRAVSAITSQVMEPGKTLIVFDEIQQQPQGLTALKYFCENAPEYHVVVAGSLLGLLGAMSDIPAKEILAESKMITKYKGAFTEQYVAQQYIATMRQPLYYYTNENSTSEIDFVFQHGAVYPTEVKAEENLKAKSLSTVLKTNAQLKGIRFSMSDYREQEQMVNVPLYLVEFYLKWIASEGL